MEKSLLLEQVETFANGAVDDLFASSAVCIIAERTTDRDGTNKTGIYWHYRGSDLEVLGMLRVAIDAILKDRTNTNGDDEI